MDAGVDNATILRVPVVNVNAHIAFVERHKTMERASSPPISAEMAAHIRFLIKEQGLYQHQAAALVGVNQGRISEVMRGKYFPNVPPAQGSLPL